MRLGPLLTAFVVAGCQVTPPLLPPAPPSISPEVRARFMSGQMTRDQRGPVLLLGTPTAVGAPAIKSASERARAVAPLTEKPLELKDVLISVEMQFPLILAALTEVAAAEGRLLEARGGFDTRLKSATKIDAQGFYESQRYDVGLEQPTTLWGATLSTGYRRGSGDFAVYDGESKTNDGGEFRLGVTLPLLQGRRIDPNRVAVWRSLIEREQAEPLVARKRLETTRKAADAYWKWMSAGQRRGIMRHLLALAEDRRTQVELGVGEGLLAPITAADNQRSVVERQSNLLLAERAMQQAAIELSLYSRDADGRPIVPPDARLPSAFPAARVPEEIRVDDDVRLALTRRPEIQALELDLAGLQLEQDLARNEFLPALDVGVFGSQDVGGDANSPDDKSRFELEVGVRLEVPFQQRTARGKLAAIEAKANKMGLELQFVRELVAADVSDSVSALTQSWQRLGQAHENVQLADELAGAERLQFEVGESDLFRVNVREQQAALAAADHVDVQAEYFRALARYYTVLGVPY